MSELWLIHKARRGWYRPNCAGYTLKIEDAGRYTFDEATLQSLPNGKNGPRDGITIKRETDVIAGQNEATP